MSAEYLEGDPPRRRMRRLRKSQDDMPAQSFGGAHRGRVCVYAFIGMSVCAFI